MPRKFISCGCGIDVSKDKFDVCFSVVTDDRELVVKGTKKFKQTPSQIKVFIAWVQKKIAKVNPEDQLSFQLVLESTGVYHEQLVYALYEAGLPACLVQPRRVNHYLKSLPENSKNDPKDAKGMSRMACERKLRKWKPCSTNILEIRAMLRHRKSLTTSRTRAKNQLHAATTGQSSNSEVKASLARQIKQADKEIKLMETGIDKLYKADLELVEKVEPIVDSLSGIGLLSVLTIISETNGFEQIKSRRQMARYCGYDIVENQSGKSSGRTKISKRGNKHIRAAMYMPAVAIIRGKKGELFDLFARVHKRNPKAYKIANVAVQRKLALLVYTLFKKGERYQEGYVSQWNKQNQVSQNDPNKDGSESNSKPHGIAISEETLPKNTKLEISNEKACLVTQ